MPPKKKKLIKRVSLRFYEDDAKLLKNLEKEAKKQNATLNEWILSCLFVCMTFDRKM